MKKSTIVLKSPTNIQRIIESGIKILYRTTRRVIMKYIALSCFALFFACSAHAENGVTDKSTGESFPSAVSFNADGKDYQLDATGVSTRKKLIIKIYSVAHYLQKGVAKDKDKLQEILSDANAKQLSIKWVRAVPADKVQEGYNESFKTAIPDPAYTQVQTAIKTYLAYFNQDVQKGDEHVIRWIPGGNIEVQINGKTVGTITAGPEFAKGLWDIWFGQKSVVNRDALMSLMN